MGTNVEAPETVSFGTRARIALRGARIKVAAAAAVAGTALVSSASAVNWTPLADLLSGLGTDVLPALLDFIMAAVPIIVALAMVSFIIGMFVAILDLLKIKF